MTAYHHRDPHDRFFEQLSKNKDLEQGLQRLEVSQTQDPVVREMAHVVLKECDKAKRRREANKVGAVIGFVFAIVLIIIVIMVKSSR